mgnify:CR=1 FL=1
MATLAGSTIASTYDSLLHVEDNTAGLVATSTDSRVIQDGVGVNSALALATDSVRITSTNKLYFNDVGGEYISGDGTDLTITSGNDIKLAVGSGGSVYHTGDGGTNNTIYGYDAGVALTTNGNYNAFFGYNAGAAITTGDQNIAIGQGAMQTHTTGNRNIAIGHNAMVDTDNNTTSLASNDNLFIGVDAGGGTWTNTAVQQNVAIGNYSMDSALDEAQENTAVGYSSLSSLTTGDRNTAIGYLALEDVQTGANNIAIGNNALKDNTTSSNIAIGVNSMQVHTTGANNICIGLSTMDDTDVHAQTKDSSHNIFIGTDAGGGTWAGSTASNYNIGIGSYSLDAAMDGAIKNVTVGYGSMSAITTGDWNTAIGHQAAEALTTGQRNTLLGYTSGLLLTGGTHNVAVGMAALATTTNDVIGCTAIGYAALGSADVTSNAHYSTAVGYSALGNLTSGHGNVAVGHQALLEHTTGGYNTAVGYQAMADTGANDCPTSTHNTAVGYECLGGQWDTNDCNYNTGVGAYVMDAVMNGAEANTAMGYAAGSALTSGDGNTLFGYHAGSGIQGGGTNVMIGYQAGVDSVTTTSGSNNVLVGTNVRASGATVSNAICIGHDIFAAGNDFTFGKASNTVSNDFDTDNAWTQSSDVRKKRNIKDAKLGLDFINDLRPVTYQWKPNYDFPEDFPEYSKENNMNLDAVMHGMIAQEVKEAIDKSGVERFGGWKEDENGCQRLSKEMFVFPLIKAVQELTAKVEELESKLNNKES